MNSNDSKLHLWSNPLLSPSARAWNRLRRWIPHSWHIVLSFSFLVSNLLWTLFPGFFFSASFFLSSPMRRWWSESISAPLLTLTSRRTLLNSVWFSTWWSGDILVALWICLCGKRLPPITSSLRAQKLAKRSQFSFICPSPSVPIIPLQSLSFPILAFRSPTILMSLLGVFWKTACSCW